MLLYLIMCTRVTDAARHELQGKSHITRAAKCWLRLTERMHALALA